MRNRKITIVGYLGYDNLGDDLMLDCLIENIQKSYPKLEIDVLTKETENIKSIVKKHKNINIYFFKNNNKLGNLKLYLKSILGSKLTIWSGGTCFSDEDGVGNFLYFFINMLLLRKFAYVGIGIGNLTNKNSIFKSKLLLNRMAFASFRDKKSFEKASLLSKNNNIYLTSDLSYIFDINKYKIKVEKPYVLVR
ncbi:polysaccharide pyruvyl transferase family protein, partial [Aquimarina sp. AD1]|uniref:polysaccharide pyruvyl transferase family protein n=1 Tax=Aquimarina sp. (strain AD1) TaxID=1714848 RepID=UPI000ED12262